MKKIDYALKNKPCYWQNMNKTEIIDNLCPSDFGLKDPDNCYLINGSQSCYKCWHEKIDNKS